MDLYQNQLEESHGFTMKVELNQYQPTELPESFSQFANLHTVGLNRNQLTEMPESFDQFTDRLTNQLSWTHVSCMAAPHSTWGAHVLCRVLCDRYTLCMETVRT